MKKKSTIMFSIDSSTTKTGITIWKNGKYFKSILINYDEKDRDKNDPIKPLCKIMDTRYTLMIHDIFEFLNQYKPSIIYIEDEVVSRNMSTCRFLFRLQGTIDGWAMMNDCEFNTVRPTSWRKSCNFKQGAGHKRDDLKAQAIQYVKQHFGMTVSDDIADSICIGVYALKLFNIKL